MCEGGEKESSVCVCVGPVIISLSAVAGVGLRRGLSVSFCHNMSH